MSSCSSASLHIHIYAVYISQTLGLRYIRKFRTPREKLQGPERSEGAICPKGLRIYQGPSVWLVYIQSKLQKRRLHGKLYYGAQAALTIAQASQHCSVLGMFYSPASYFVSELRADSAYSCSSSVLNVEACWPAVDRVCMLAQPTHIVVCMCKRWLPSDNPIENAVFVLRC